MPALVIDEIDGDSKMVVYRTRYLVDDMTEATRELVHDLRRTVTSKPLHNRIMRLWAGTNGMGFSVKNGSSVDWITIYYES